MKNQKRRRAAVVAAGLAITTALGGAARAASLPAQPTQDTRTAQPASAAAGSVVPSAPRLTAPDRVLPEGWRSSADRAVAVVGDDNGLNILVADAKDGYAWRTAASLSEPGFDSPKWIGNACVTGSGRYAAVVYGPWSFANDTNERDHGGFAAIVDLDTGAVRKLPQLVNLAYYSPGCGITDDVALSALDESSNATTVTRLEVVDATTGATVQQAVIAGEVTSPVPYNAGIAASLGNDLVAIGAQGTVSVLAAEKGIPFRVHPDSAGGVAYEVPDGGRVQVKRYARGENAVVGTGVLGQVQLAGSAGHVYLVGPGASKIELGVNAATGWRSLGGAVDSTPSSLGQLLVSEVSNEVDPQVLGAVSAKAKSSLAQSVLDRIAIGATVTATGKAVSFTIDPAAMHPDQGKAASPALALNVGGTGRDIAPSKASSGAPAATGKVARSAAANASQSTVNMDDSSQPAYVTWDPVRGCAVARNDPSIQTFQANAAQIEWAADLAVQGQLTTQTRGVNWEGSGMPISWTPQGMFPLQSMDGGGTVPAQILLGVLAQESNTLQASSHAVDAETGNFNQGGFYGSVSDPSIPNGTTWDTVDCGYGTGQVTTGMTIGYTGNVADGSSAYTTAEQQQAIATDYASNIAATVNLLIDKWNQLYTAGILANGGSPQYIENWYFAAWAYNSGVEPDTAARGNTTGCTPGPACTDGSGNWGLGWANNPSDPVYEAGRAMFTANVDFDTSHPQYWSYEEKVMGWAATPVARFNYAAGAWGAAYSAAVWPSTVSSPSVSEPLYTEFCVSSEDNCQPDAASDESGTANSAGLCTLANSHCWWHYADTWQHNCLAFCGTQKLSYTASSARPSFTDIYTPDGCTTSGLPSNAVIVDTTVSAGTCSGTRQWSSQGSMSLYFPASENSACSSDCIQYQGKIDFHQVGTGFGGHIFFSHMDNTPVDTGTSYTDDSMTATWAPPSSVAGWTRIKVHVPDSGATTRQADYQINLGGGQSRHRLVNQHLNQNTWVDLGSFDLAAGASVSLSNYNTYAVQGDGGDVAFDAVAFIPTVQPAVNYVAIGDSYSSGESLSPYLYGSDITYANGVTDSCHRSNQAYPYAVTRAAVSPTPIEQVSAADGPANFAFIACSGAETVDLTASAVNPANTWNTDWSNSAANESDYGELYEIDASGYLDPDTTLVTITIGGNDARFADVITGCLQTATICTDPGYYLKRTTTGVTDPLPLTTYEPEVITAEQTQLQAVYTAIHAQAPNAEVLVLGYPHLFPPSSQFQTSCSLATYFPITGDVVDWMNQMSDDLDASIQAAISALKVTYPTANITFVDTQPTFAGHGVCSTDPWINGIVGTGSSASFHPMAIGHAAEAALVNSIN